MNMHRPSWALTVVLIATQILGLAALLPAEQQDGWVKATNHMLISAISGEPLTAQSTSGSKILRFRDTLEAGDLLATGDRTVADVLIGNRAVLTLGKSTTAQLTTVTPGQTTIQVTQGIVRVAASVEALGEQGTITIQTPTGQVQTRGGIVRVMVDAPVGSAEQPQTIEAKPYLASYSPNPILAAIGTRGDIIQVEEGTAEILGAGPGGEALTVQAGQSVTRQSGQAGSISELETPGEMRAGVLASADHTNTPKEGLEHLVALQVDQAAALGRALTGETELGQSQDKSAEKDNVENAIIGPTGGVSLNNTIVNTLFGGGDATNPSTPNPTESTGGGFSRQKSNSTAASLGSDTDVLVNGGPNALLVFTKKEPVEPIVIAEMTLPAPFDSGGDDISFEADSFCDFECFTAHRNAGKEPNIGGRRIMSGDSPRSPLTIISEFTVERELVLVGGTNNNFHGGIAPTERLIIRGAAPDPSETKISNVDIDPQIIPDPYNLDFIGRFPSVIEQANSTFVVRVGEDRFGNSTLGAQGDVEDTLNGGPLYGGILGQFANDSRGPANTFLGTEPSTEQLKDVTLSIDILEGGVTGAITATSSTQVPVVDLTGGVTLDRGTKATIGTTEATNNYFSNSNHNIPDAQLYNGSLLAVIDGPNSVPTALTVQDRLLGVYDGSKIDMGTDGGNKALLSVLDAQLKGPSRVPLIDIDAAYKDADTANGAGSGATPNVTVTSAVVTRSTIPLDGALLAASAPILALTQAMMTTESHFADLAGNKAQSMRMDDALVALNASQLIIKGNLLNLNAATATVNGYLFSLNNSSTLTLSNGALFSLNNGSSLNLNGNAFGVFGNGANTLSITNNLCATRCGMLVNSANTPFMLNGSPLKVAGVSQNVVLPASFNVFAGNPASTVAITANDALFHVDSTSTLTINGTVVVKQ